MSVNWNILCLVSIDLHYTWKSAEFDNSALILPSLSLKHTVKVTKTIDSTPTQLVLTKFNMDTRRLDNYRQVFGGWSIARFNVSWFSWAQQSISTEFRLITVWKYVIIHHLLQPPPTHTEQSTGFRSISIYLVQTCLFGGQFFVSINSGTRERTTQVNESVASTAHQWPIHWHRFMSMTVISHMLSAHLRSSAVNLVSRYRVDPLRTVVELDVQLRSLGPFVRLLRWLRCLRRGHRPRLTIVINCTTSGISRTIFGLINLSWSLPISSNTLAFIWTVNVAKPKVAAACYCQHCFRPVAFLRGHDGNGPRIWCCPHFSYTIGL